MFNRNKNNKKNTETMLPMHIALIIILKNLHSKAINSSTFLVAIFLASNINFYTISKCFNKNILFHFFVCFFFLPPVKLSRMYNLLLLITKRW